MLVKNWMSKPVVTIDVDANISDAIKKLQIYKIHMLPVKDDSRLVGTLTEQDLKSVSGYDCKSSISLSRENHILQKAVSKIMTVNPIAISYDQTIEETAELLLVHKILGLPVLDHARKLVGIITKSDIIRFLITIVGSGKEGIEFAIELVDRPGCVKEVTDTMRDYGGRVGSIFSTRERAKKGYRRAYIRLYNLDRPSFLRLKEVLKERVKFLYILNRRENISEIF